MNITFYRDVTLDRTHKHVTSNISAYLSHFEEYVVDVPAFSPLDEIEIDIQTFRNFDGINYCKISTLGYTYYYFVEIVYPISVSTAKVRLFVDDWAMFIGNCSFPTISGVVTRSSTLLDNTTCYCPVNLLSGGLPQRTHNADYSAATKYQHLAVACTIVDSGVERVVVLVSAAPFAENTVVETVRELGTWLEEIQLSQTLTIGSNSFDLKAVTGAWAIYPPSVSSSDYQSAWFSDNRVTTYHAMLRPFASIYTLRLTDLEPNRRMLIGNRTINTIIDTTPYSTAGGQRMTVEISQSVSLTESAVSTVLSVGDNRIDVTEACKIPVTFVSSEMTRTQRITRDAINLTTGAISLAGSVATKNPIGIASSATQIGSTVADMLTRVTGNALALSGGYLTSCYGYFNAYAPDIENEEYLLSPVDFYYMQSLNAEQVNNAIFSEGYITNDKVQEFGFTDLPSGINHRYLKFSDLLFGGFGLLRPYYERCRQYFIDGVHIWYDTTTTLEYGNYGVNV